MFSNPLFADYLSSTNSPLSLNDLFTYFSDNKRCYLFIKDRNSRYAYANDAFYELLGIKNLKKLIGKSDYDFYDDKALVKQYIDDDTSVFEEEKTISLLNDVKPKHNASVITTMQGKLFPLAIHHEKPDYVLGIVSPTTHIKKRDWDTIFQLTTSELNQLLTKRRYAIATSWGITFLSKREIQVLFELIHGYHAGQIAHRLHVTQTTIESYLVTIKNKLCMSSKNELISFIITSKLFHQIL